MKESYSTRDYDDFIRKSTHGNRTRRETKSQFVPRERYNNLIEEANLRLKRMLLIAISMGVIGIAGGYIANDAIEEGIPDLVDDIHVSSEIAEQARTFRSEFIRDNVGRSSNLQNYWYDYPRIYEGLNSFGDGDYDKNVYYSYLELGSRYTSQLLDYSSNDSDHDYCYIIEDEDGKKDTRSFRNYLYKNGYYEEGSDMLDDKAYEKAIDNFSETMENRFKIEYAFEKKEKQFNEEQNERMDELNQMMDEHNMSGPKNSSKGGK